MFSSGDKHPGRQIPREVGILITLKDLSMEYDGRKVLSEVNLDIPRSTITAIVGPSGSGKTTLLRLIDLLEEPTFGMVLHNGFDINRNENRRSIEIRRRIGMVLQRPVLFNGDVGHNVAYGLKLRGQKGNDVDTKVLKALHSVGLEGYEKKNSNTLSGGEIQRVAIARALVTEPELLLLDEPTSTLDPIATKQIENLIGAYTSHSETTVIMTTHDMNQGRRLADTIAIIMDGNVIQADTPNNVFNMPNSMEVANFVGTENVLEGTIISSDDGIATVQVEERVVEVISDREIGSNVYVCIRPEEITISLAQSTTSSARNTYAAQIEGIIYNHPLAHVVVNCGFDLTVFVTARSANELGFAKGNQVMVSFKATGVHIIAR